MLALLSACIPLSMTLTSTLVAVKKDRDLIVNASPQELVEASSIHVLAFSSTGDLLLTESEGNFNLEVWENAYDMAWKACNGRTVDSADEMVDTEDSAMESFVRQTMEEKIATDLKWKADVK